MNEIEKKIEAIVKIAKQKGFDSDLLSKNAELIKDDSEMSRYACAMLISTLKGFPASLLQYDPVLEQLKYLEDWTIEDRSFGTNIMEGAP